jgi:hypothetical protein
VRARGRLAATRFRIDSHVRFRFAAGEGAWILPDHASERAAIGVRLEKLEDLFEKFDPAPMGHGDLAPDIANYVAERAARFPNEPEFDLRLHLPVSEAARARRMDLTQHIQTYFQMRAEQHRRHLSEVFRSGRQALAIGLAVLVACLLLAWLLRGGDDYSLAWLVKESLVVIGWVAIWRPAETFLYDWIPIERQKRMLFRLARSTFTVVDSAAN